MTDTPYLADGKELEGLDAFHIAVYQAAMAVAGISFCKVACHLGKRLVGGDTDADGHSHALLHSLVEPFAPSFQVKMLHPFEIYKALVDTVTEIGGCLLTDNLHHTTGEFAIQLIVGGKDGNLLLGEELGKLVVRRSCLDSHLLGFIRTCHYASVVIRENNHRLVLQVGPKDTLTRYVTIVTVYDAVHDDKLSVFSSF